MDRQLIIFDVDGVLVKKYTTQFLPQVKEYFSNLRLELEADKPIVALVSNQGGVGLRYSLEQDGQAEFANEKGYPTQEAAELRLGQIAAVLGIPFSRIYVSFAYKTNWGIWTPTPMSAVTDQRWFRNWRMPGTGMLYQAMADVNMGPSETLVVGNREEAEWAARSAGCAFAQASAFFVKQVSFGELVPA